MQFHVLFLIGTVLAQQSTTSYCAAKAQSLKSCIHSTNPTPDCCKLAVNEFRNQRCFCNKVAVAFLGTTSQGPPSQAQILNVLTKCGSTAPPSCTEYGTKTYFAGTCQTTDQELDFARFVAAKKFSDTLLSFADQTGCFDFKAFKAAVGNTFSEISTIYAGQGLGTYTGLDHIAEYFSLLAPSVNRGFLKFKHSKMYDVMVTISPNGQEFTVSSFVSNEFADGTYTRNLAPGGLFTDYLEVGYVFRGCETKAIYAHVPSRSRVYNNQRTTGVVALTEMLYKTVNADTRLPSNNALPNLGIMSICKQHTKYCVGKNSQFASESDCLSFYKSLPRYSAKCGSSAIASGNSVTCRAKHQFMAAISPEIHCPHLGKYI
jgi:hypothetical protein